MTNLIHFDLGLTPRAWRTLECTIVKRGGVYDNFNQPDAYEADLLRLFRYIGNPLRRAQRQAVHAANVLKALNARFGQQSSWIAVRVTTPSSAFDVPRWHPDGYYYKPYQGLQRKSLVTLKGRTTLLAELSAASMKDVRAIVYDTSLPVRRAADNLVRMKGLVTSAPTHMATEIATGGDNATIHSEPSFREARIFASAVPGTYEQIEELRIRRGLPQICFDLR